MDWLLLSGGADSVASLHVLMAENPKRELTCISFEWPQHLRNLAERLVIAQLAKDYPTVRFSSYRIEGFRRGDVISCLQAVIHAQPWGSADKVVLYSGMADMHPDEPFHGMDLAGMQRVTDALVEAHRINQAFYTDRPFPDIEIRCPVRHNRKREIVKLARGMYWSCRRPMLNREQTLLIPCNDCQSCDEIRAAGGEHPTLHKRQAPVLYFR